MGSYLVTFANLTGDATTTANAGNAFTFLAVPLLGVLFAVTVVLAGIYVIKRLLVMRAIGGAKRIVAGGGRRGRGRRR